MTVLRRMVQLVEDLKAFNVIDSLCEINYESNDDYHQITIKRHPQLGYEREKTIRQSFMDEFSSSAKLKSNSDIPCMCYYITCTIKSLEGVLK